MSKRQFWQLAFGILTVVLTWSANKTDSSSPSPSVPPVPSPVAEVDQDGWMVTHVADGDTITVESAGSELKVRVLGINTPESVDPRRAVECFGREASERMKGLLTGETVSLIEDSSQGSTDKYGRALRYVENDGVDIGLQLVKEGFAYEYTYNKPYARQAAYREAQRQAEAAGRGLWAADTCNGQK